MNAIAAEQLAGAINRANIPGLEARSIRPFQGMFNILEQIQEVVCDYHGQPLIIQSELRWSQIRHRIRNGGNVSG